MPQQCALGVVAVQDWHRAHDRSAAWGHGSYTTRERDIPIVRHREADIWIDRDGEKVREVARAHVRA